MKLVSAIIKPFKLQEVREALVDSGIEEGLNSMPSIGKPRLPREKVDLLYTAL